jgi:hypothetical protein
MTSTGTAPELDRVAALERRVRWMSSLIMFLTLGFILLIGWTFVPRRHRVDAPAFRVRDSEGRVRAELGMWEDRPMMRLNSPEGKARAIMFVRDDGRAAFQLNDRDNAHRLQLTLDEDGHPGVVLANSEGRSMVAILAEPDGRATLALRDEKLEPLWSAPTEKSQAAESR